MLPSCETGSNTRISLNRIILGNICTRILLGHRMKITLEIDSAKGNSQESGIRFFPRLPKQVNPLFPIQFHVNGR